MKKELTLLGLGRMGCAMGEHLVEQGYTVHGFAPGEESRKNAKAAGVTVHNTTADAVSAQGEGEKLVWLMVPSKVVDEVIEEVSALLVAGDCIIDGGNSFFKDSLRRHEELSKKEIRFLDSGTSGGLEGARYGAAVMVGGDAATYEKYEHVFRALATENGYARVGGPGAGHFVKMIHNGIEYGMMGAIAEGMNVLHERQAEFDIDIDAVLNPYENGSIITSSLVSWLVEAYRTPEYLERIAGEVPRGETEEEMEYIVDNEEVMVLRAALEQRRETRKNPSRIGTLISAMRNQFGGHKTIEKHEDT